MPDAIPETREQFERRMEQVYPGLSPETKAEVVEREREWWERSTARHEQQERLIAALERLADVMERRTWRM